MNEKPRKTIPQPLGLYAGDLRRRAQEFLTAFERLSSDSPEDLAFPRYFLMAHSIELFLKAFLAAHGMSKSELRKRFSHDLEKILPACLDLGLQLRSEYRAGILNFHEMNRHYDLRYPSAYRLTLPSPPLAMELATAIDQAIAPTVEGQRIRDELKFHSEHRGFSVQWIDE